MSIFTHMSGFDYIHVKLRAYFTNITFQTVSMSVVNRLV
jgi:hypothetical protein